MTIEKTLKTYHVTWEIELDATSHQEAAELALEVQRDSFSVATVFTVQDVDDLWGYVETTDLEEEQDQ